MRTLYRLLRAGMHTALLFVLPWLTGALVGLAFDVQEVEETTSRFATLFSVVVVPLFVLQMAAITIKIAREVRAQHAAGRRGFAVWVDAIDRHVRILTERGLGMAAVSLLMVVLALAAKWGQFGVLAVAGLGIMYLASTGATLISAFAVRAFDDRVRRGRGAIEREMSPPVVDAGDAVEERFLLTRVPVPPGFRLHIEEDLPARLGGDTRFALDRSVSRAEATVSAPLPRTPRGVYRLGPASIWYEDILGLTRVFVASRACASLRALPRVRPVLFEKRPRSHAKAEGPLSILARLATEDHFRTKPYVAGDDLRRVHWKQSINTGQLVVRLPESVPHAPSRIRLVLDTFLPPGFRIAANTDGARPRRGERVTPRAPDAMEDVLDLLVDAWIGLAHVLLRRGEAVTLVCAIREGDATVLRDISCRRGEERKWRAVGSDASWQNDVTLDAILAKLATSPQGGGKPPSTVVVSAGLWLGETARAPGTSFVVADGASVIPDAAPAEVSLAKRLLFFDYPVGAEDNRLDLRRLLAPRPPAPSVVRANLATATAQAIEQMRVHCAPTLVVRRKGLALVLETP